MVLEKFSIVLDNPVKVFFPGQLVTGHVEITITDQPEEIAKSITVECKGAAQVEFTALNRYRATEEYFKFITPVLVAPRVGQFKLPVGQHQYSFIFRLPSGIPSSFEGIHGRIGYVLTADLYSVDRARGCLVLHAVSTLFNVNTIIDLNTIPEARLPLSATDCKSRGFWCCKNSKAITAKIWLDRNGYVPSETLYFNAQVDNQSRRPMRGSRIQLIEDSTFFLSTKGKSEKKSRIIIEKHHGPFDESDVWSNESFVIPGIAPSTLPYCNIIHISYRIKLMVLDDDWPNSSNILVCSLPIIIGNLPIRPIIDSSSFHQLPVVGYQQQESSVSQSNPNYKLPALSSVPDYPDLPPASFEEGIFPTTIFSNNGLVYRGIMTRYVTYASPASPSSTINDNNLLITL